MTTVLQHLFFQSSDFVPGDYFLDFTAHFLVCTEHDCSKLVTTFTCKQNLSIFLKIINMKVLNTRAALGRSEFIEVEKNVRLHVTDFGEGRPVILIHGWPLSDAMFEYQYPALIKNGYRPIGITLRGFGQSDKPYGRYDYDVFAEDIKVVMEDLRIENAVLGGFSFGGATVIRFATKYQNEHISKLALFGAAAPCEVRKADFPYGLPIEILNSLIELNSTNRPQLIEEFGKLFAATETALPNTISDWLAKIQFQSSQYAMEQGLYMIKDSDLRADLDKISIPTAIFHGKLDKLCPFELAEQLHKGIANSKLIAFENSGHALFLEECQKFNYELIKFIKEKSSVKDFAPTATKEMAI
ncbi:MAG TPA: alpha/beta hydrolase [Segetibacter sp.]|nr:alpha/beta hydrolase [Segetibacter sp.]